jgi:hypothetical protein
MSGSCCLESSVWRCMWLSQQPPGKQTEHRSRRTWQVFSAAMVPLPKIHHCMSSSAAAAAAAASAGGEEGGGRQRTQHCLHRQSELAAHISGGEQATGSHLRQENSTRLYEFYKRPSSNAHCTVTSPPTHQMGSSPPPPAPHAWREPPARHRPHAAQASLRQPTKCGVGGMWRQW